MQRTCSRKSKPGFLRNSLISQKGGHWSGNRVFKFRSCDFFCELQVVQKLKSVNFEALVSHKEVFILLRGFIPDSFLRISWNRFWLSERKARNKKTNKHPHFFQSQENKSVLIEENKKAIEALRKVIYFQTGILEFGDHSGHKNSRSRFRRRKEKRVLNF